MKLNIEKVYNNIAEYWDTQKQNFYFGMVLCFLFITQLMYSNLIFFSPVFAVGIYSMIWLFNFRKKPTLKYYLKCAITALVGALWTFLFLFL